MELKVVFRNNLQQKLIGVWSTPTVEAGEYYPAVVLCHGFNVDKDKFFLPQMTKQLVEAGFAVLRFDCRGCGESEGDFHPTFNEMAQDIAAAVKFVASKEDVEFIGLAGHSMGGSASLMAASRLAEVGAVASIAGVGDTKKLAEEKLKGCTQNGEHYVWQGKYGTFLLPKEYFSEAKDLDMYTTVAQLGKPLLVVQGMDDTRVNFEQGMQLFLRASMPKSIKKIVGCDHWFEGYERVLIESVTDFFEKWLKPKEDESEEN